MCQRISPSSGNKEVFEHLHGPSWYQTSERESCTQEVKHPHLRSSTCSCSGPTADGVISPCSRSSWRALCIRDDREPDGHKPHPLELSSARMLYCSCSLAASCCLQLCWALQQQPASSFHLLTCKHLHVSRLAGTELMSDSPVGTTGRYVRKPSALSMTLGGTWCCPMPVSSTQDVCLNF